MRRDHIFRIVKALNNKTLKNEIETPYFVELHPTYPFPLNNKTLKNEIETIPRAANDPPTFASQ